MPTKTAKKGSAKKPNAAGAAVVNKSWESALTIAPFEEESWQACVSLVVERSAEDEELIRALSVAVQKPLRKRFSLLTWDSTLAKIHELGNPRAKKCDDLPTFYEVTEPAKALLDAGIEIPCDLMAKILKFQLLQIKASDKQRREAERAEEEKAKAGPPSGRKDRGARVSAKKEKSPLSPPSKEKTKLKRRDVVEPPNVKDDEPEDGPQHYILLVGFYQPRLIGALDAIGVHVANVIKLYSEHTHTAEEPQGKHSSENRKQSLNSSPEHRGDAQLAVRPRNFHLFWSGLRPVLDSGPPESKLHDVVLLNYTVADPSPPLNTQDPEAKLHVGIRIFDGVANLIYDCLDWRRQHRRYLDNVKLISIPAVVGFQPQQAEAVSIQSLERKLVRESPSNRETAPPAPPAAVDMRRYTRLLDLVPPEACSVPLMLHCMLEQVCVVSAEQLPEELEPQRGLDHQTTSFMLRSFLPLASTEEERSRMMSSLTSAGRNEEDVKKFEAENQKKPEHPLVIDHHNERALRLRDVTAAQDFDPADVESSMMRLSPVWKLIHSGPQQTNNNSSWMAIRQQLQRYSADDVVSWREVERFLHQSVFESMPLTRPDREGVLLDAPGPLEPAQRQPPAVIPWDDPLSYAKQQLNESLFPGHACLIEDPGNTQQISGRVCNQLELPDIQSCRLRSLSDWHHTEHHDASVFPQVLQSASEEYRCLDMFRGSHNNILYIFCHNPMSPYRQCKEFWDVALHTDVKFRKYLEHVADTISDWTKEQESKREAMQLRNLSPPEPLKDEKAADSAEEDTLEPVIRKDSLKAWKLEQERLKEEEMAKKSKKENMPKGMQQKEEAKPADRKKSKTSSSGRKSRAETFSSSAKTSTESISATTPPEAENAEPHQTEEPVCAFTGYSTDGKVIHVSGCLQYLFPSHGGQVTVETVRYVEGSSLMKVAVRKDGHRFYTHVNDVVVDPTEPRPQDKESKTEDVKVSEPVAAKRVKQGSLTAVLHNGVHLSYSCYGPTGEYTVTPQNTEEAAAEASTSSPIPLSSSPLRSKGTDPESVPSLTHNHTRPSESQVCEVQPVLPSCPFNSLSLSVPNGLLLQFLREETQGASSEGQGVLVRQSFPLHGRGVVGQLPDPSLSKELSRVVTGQGAVIRHMRDGSTEVLFADGSVSVSPDSGPVWVPESEAEEDDTSKEPADSTTERSSQMEAHAQRGCWLTTTPSGKRIHTVGTAHKHIPTTPLRVYKATDPITHEVMLSREDLVVSVQSPDGSLSVEHADGTRITSFYQDRPPNKPQHTGEQPDSATLESPSQCACGFPECVCVTRRVDSINDNVHIPDTSDSGAEIRRDKAEAGNDCEHVCGERERGVRKNDEERVFVAGNGEGSASTKERVLLVEKEGCATVVMYAERHTAHVFLADGTVITGNNQGAYQVFPSNMGLLQIHSDGKSVYSSDPLVTPSPKGSPPANQPGSYTMSHTDKVACDITDLDGSHYEVMEDGQLSVLNLSPAPSTLKPDEEEAEEETDGEMDRINIKHREHCPRLFLVHEDGSGTELLNSPAVDELLRQEYSDPNTVVLREPLPETQDDFAITILKPGRQSAWSQWLLGKQNPDITPPNLRNRTWHDFPRTEKKKPGPPFGTDIGRGLTLREGSGSGSAAQHRTVRSCPKVLEIRELYQHRPFTTLLRNTVDTQLKDYTERLMEREQRSEEAKVKDPLSEEQCAHGSGLLNLVLYFAEEEAAGHTFDKRTSEDIVSLYNQGLADALEQSVSEDTSTVTSDSVTGGKESKWNERLAQHRQEIREEQAHREALRKKNVVPFFHPENISLHQDLLQHQTPDIRSLSMDLSPIPKSDSAEASLKDAPQESTPRPLNPTPSQSASHAGGSGRKHEKRPTNPTPQSAGERSLGGSSVRFKSVQVDVTGKPRRTKVRLPASILSSKPCSVPNQQFLSVEEPVRRKCRTVSLTDPNVLLRGFQLLPSSVDFGTLREGTSSAITVRMRNVGVDTCRFRVKQPPPSTGLRVIYNPGPVAAGLHVDLQVQLFALCAVQAGATELQTNISLDIIIHTEMDILYLPVTATILTQRFYHIWLKGYTSAHSKKGARVGQLTPSPPDEGRGRTDDPVPY